MSPEALDAADPLARFRDRFRLPAATIYLDGNSLGALPEATVGRIADTVQREWGRDLIRSWNANGWIEAPARIGAAIAPLVGADATEVIACDSTSINLHKLLAAALAARPGRRAILSEPGNFPTDLYMAQGLRDAELRLAPRDALIDAIDPSVAVVMLTHVHYKSGAVHDMAAITAAAHRAGALALWDLSHSAGAIPVDLAGCGADLAVGCGYKYLNGGPGAPAWLYVAERHQAALANPLSGWMGHAAPFAFEDGYRPADGMGRWLCGTPPMLSLLALEAGVAVVAEAGMAAIEAKRRTLSTLLVRLMAERCQTLALASPADVAARGSHVSFAHPEAHAMCQALIARGLIGDFRAPDILRLGLTPLYLSHVDVVRAVDHIAAVIATREWDRPAFRARAVVT